MTERKHIHWTPVRDAALRHHWATGLSARKIGEAMGVGKNSVIGRAHRLGLPKRESPFTERRRDQRTARVIELKASTAPAHKGPNQPIRYAKARLSRYPTCQFIAGAPTADAEKCGAPTAEHSRSYCEEHHAVCYVAGSGHEVAA